MSRADLVAAVNKLLYGDDKAQRASSGFTTNYLGKLERGLITWPRTPGYRAALRAVLRVGTNEELGFTDPGADRPPDPIRNPEPVDTPDGSEEPTGAAQTPVATVVVERAGVASNPMRRRTMLTWGAMNAAAAGLGIPVMGAVLESTRHGLDTEAAVERSQATTDEWREIVREHGYRYMVTAPADMLDAVTIDTISVRQALSADHDSRTRAELRRAAALLAVFTAMTVANLGDVHQGRRWWRTAKRLADQSGDPSTVIWVRGREIVRAQYERFPAHAVLELVRQADVLADAAPDSAKTEYISGKAQALAMAGLADQARSALHQAQRIYENLPAEITADSGSLLGWPADRMLFTTSYVHSYLGDYARARTAQQQAVAAYPPGHRRGPAQIELQHALCLAKVGDTDTAVRHAQDVITTLPADDRIRPVLDLAQRVHAAVPDNGRHRHTAADYRQFLNLVATPGGPIT